MPSPTRYNYTQIYLLISDLLISFLWFTVHLRFLLLLPLTGIRFLPGGIADFYLIINVLTILIDVFNYVTIFGKIPKESKVPRPRLPNLICTFLERLVVNSIILNYPRVARSTAFATLIYSESLVEIIRYYYNFYKVRTFARFHKTLRLVKKLSYTFLVPLQVAMEMILVFNSLQFETYYEPLQQYDGAIKVGIRSILVFYLPIFYTVFKNKLYEYYYLSWSNKSVTGHAKRT